MRVEIEQVEGRRLIARARGNELVIDDTMKQVVPVTAFGPRNC